MPVKILVADDSATMRKVLELTFAGEDAQVISVDSVAAAFAEAQKSTPDVIFADLSMPGDDGYALARMIKSTPALSRAAVVVLSSTHTPYDPTKGGAAGVDDHLDKPFESKVAIEMVASVLVKPRASASAMPAAAAAAAPAAAPASTGPVLSAASRPSKRTVAFGTPAIPQAGARPAPPQPPVQRPTPAKPPEAPPAAAPHAAPPAAPRPAPVLELAPDEDLAPSRAAQAAPKPAQAPAAPAPQPQAARAPVAKVAAATSAASPMAAKLGGLGLDATQLEAILALSREVVEQVVWEVVPEIAEAIIREEIRRLTAE